MKELLASILFPGLGHLLTGRYLKGAVLAVCFSLVVEVLLWGGLVWPEPFQTARLGLWGLAVGIWVYGWLSVGWEVLGRCNPEAQRQRDLVLMEGMKSLLGGNLVGAERAFRTVLRLDDRDVEAWLYLGRTCELLGQAGRARRYYRAAGRLDLGGKWSWELSERLAGKARSTSQTTA